MEKLKISPEWTIEERNLLHKMIFTKQENISKKMLGTRRSLFHDPAFVKKLGDKTKKYLSLLVFLKNEYSAEFLEQKREDYKEFIC